MKVDPASDAKGQRLELSEVYVQPQNGIDVMLTINYDIQSALERELDNVVTKYRPDNTLAIVMDNIFLILLLNILHHS